MSYTMYTPLNVWLDPASVTDVVAYIQNYLSENTIYSEEEIEELIHDYLIAHPELIGGVQSVNGKTGTVVLSASDINTENNVTIESVLASLSSQISSIAANVATNTANITSLTGRVSTAETDLSALKSSLDTVILSESRDATASSTTFIPFEIEAGKSYRITNNTSGLISCTTRETQSGPNIDDVGSVGAGLTLDWTAVHSASIFRAYCAGAGSVSIEALSKRLPVVEEALNSITNTIEITGTANGTTYASAYLKAGDAIVITNNTSSIVNGRTRNTQSGSNIDNIGAIQAGATLTFSVTADAMLIGFYFTVSGTVTVKKGALQNIESAVSKRFTIGSGARFTTLRAGIAEAIKYPNSFVFVKDGVYNLIDEFATEINASTTSKYGIKLGNDVHVVFSSGAIVHAEYTGSDQNVTSYFNPFYSDDGGYTIENLNIIAKNTRYCLHDENGGGVNPRTVKILNSQFDFDNTTAPINYYPQCIGGGNGIHDFIVIRGCYFKTKAAESTAMQIVSYHQNGYSADSQSNIYVSDCYFADKGTFRATFFGTTTKVSKAYVTGCSFGSAPYTGQEVSSNPAPENYELIEWNNIVRT